MTMPKLAGVFAPICTPFRDDEEVDYDALAFNMERYAASGLLGYLALGSNGENRSLTEEERRRVLECIIRRKGPKQVVMAGAAYDAQRDTERFLKAAADLGADCGLVLSPGYFKKQMTEETLYRYFSTLAGSAPLPLLLYNAPGFCGVTLSPALVGRLAAHPHIVGMKDSAPSGIENFLRFESESFHALAGSANFLFPAMMGGSIGGTVSLANSFPELPPGTFTELDLDENGILAPANRPHGCNTANIVVGLIRNFTANHPEGMTRVILLGDPSREVGSIAEPECRRILAALDLAQERNLPLEWFTHSAGAKISMESGTENMDWIARVLRRLIEFTQAGCEVNVMVAGINVGAQPYWNAEATMLMHTRGILIMMPESAMVLTGK
ncbi:MAG: dihydrodipicolinate synthase family protein, partial [Acidobacteriia bacterium]|nr:dihydrodipicolinate synthase family protein [Terriglobia bacterium]